MTTKKGAQGEEIACTVLQSLDFVVIHRNYHSPWGEIDIIATKNNRLHFIEVKTTYGPYNPAENFHKTKLRRFIKTAKVYCYMNNIPENMIHIDLALVDMKSRIFNFVQDANLYFN